jgi:hypothetical protein
MQQTICDVCHKPFDTYGVKLKYFGNILTSSSVGGTRRCFWTWAEKQISENRVAILDELNSAGKVPAKL